MVGSKLVGKGKCVQYILFFFNVAESLRRLIKCNAAFFRLLLPLPAPVFLSDELTGNAVTTGEEPKSLWFNNSLIEGSIYPSIFTSTQAEVTASRSKVVRSAGIP